MTIIAINVILCLLVVCGFKAMLGFRWSWEKCQCCGKKQYEHDDKEKKNG